MMRAADGTNSPSWFTATPVAVGAFLLGLTLLCLDAFTVTDGLASVLFTAILVLPAGRWQRRGVLTVAGLCVLLTTATFLIAHGTGPARDAMFRRLVSITAIGATTLLVLRSLAESNTLAEQARLLDLTDDAIFVRNAGDIITYWNRGAERLYGWSRQEVLGQSAHALLRTLFPVPQSSIEAILAQTGRWEGELVNTTKAGAQVVVASRWARQIDADGGGLSTLETSTDISRRREADRELRRSEERYRAIFHTAGMAIWEEDYSHVLLLINELRDQGVTDLSGYFANNPAFVRRCVQAVRIVDVNDSAMRMFEAERKQDLTESLERVYLPGTTGSFAHVLTAIAEGARSCAAETKVRSLRGRPLSVLVSMTLPSEPHRMDAVLVTIMDVTERRRAEEDLARAQESLARVTQISTLGELTAAIAHEVNQPLAAIVTNAEASLRWLHRSIPNAAEASEAIERVIHDGQRATEVAARIRTFQGAASSRRAPFDLRAVIEEACLLMGRDTQDQGVTVGLELEPGLPAVIGDRIQIEQVILNLLTNGIQAMADTPPPQTLTIRAARHGDGSVIVQVRDTGNGIAPADRAQLFRPFFTTKPDGMGMGLSICHSIIEAHGGGIWASAEIARGAVIQFTLPAAASYQGLIFPQAAVSQDTAQ